jgi:hypothetical protein
MYSELDPTGRDERQDQAKIENITGIIRAMVGADVAAQKGALFHFWTVPVEQAERDDGLQGALRRAGATCTLSEDELCVMLPRSSTPTSGDTMALARRLLLLALLVDGLVYLWRWWSLE